MNYKESTEFLFSQLPMYQRDGKSAYKADLKNIETLCRYLDNPQDRFKSIHIAGTNGKGSVSHMIASILQTAGYKTGLYTSPHLKDFRERIKINGEMIAENEVIEFVENNKTLIDEIKPSFFEMTVAMAFQYFAKEKIDVAVIEVGLGGRLDSTNIITPLLSVITNISFDHTQLLGNSIQAIAYEKAGIIKNNIPVIIGETQSESEVVFKTVTNEKNAAIYFADQTYSCEVSKSTEKNKMVLNIISNCRMIYKDLILDLQGFYQRKNIITVLKSIDLLHEEFNLNEQILREGLENVKAKTKFAGRWHILGNHPLIIADTGHNPAGIKEVVSQINTYSFKNLRWIFGTVNDKDIDEILKILPISAIYYFTKAEIPRALDETILNQKAGLYGLKGYSFHHTKDALAAAKNDANPEDLIFIGGSTFVVAELLN